MIRITTLSQLDERTNSEGNKLAIFSDGSKNIRAMVEDDGIKSLLDRLGIEVLYVNARKRRGIAEGYGIVLITTQFFAYRDGNLVGLSNGDTTAKDLRRNLHEWYR